MEVGDKWALSNNRLSSLVLCRAGVRGNIGWVLFKVEDELSDHKEVDCDGVDAVPFRLARYLLMTLPLRVVMVESQVVTDAGFWQLNPEKIQPNNKYNQNLITTKTT